MRCSDSQVQAISWNRNVAVVPRQENNLQDSMVACSSLTQEGNHGQATVLDLCCLQAEHLLRVVVAGQAQGVKEATWGRKKGQTEQEQQQRVKTQTRDAV